MSRGTNQSKEISECIENTKKGSKPNIKLKL